MPRLLFIVDDDSYFCSHRLHLGRAARRAGYEVLVATHVEHHGKVIEDEGFRLIPIALRRGFRNPFQDLAALWELFRICRRERPDLVHTVALKMVLFGGLAARLAGVPAKVHAITGLGHLFHDRSGRTGLIRAVITPLLRWAIDPTRSMVIVQNGDDRFDLLQTKVIDESHTVIIRGAGVDTQQFHPTPEPPGDPIAVLPARMLRDKGVGEFVEAARRLRQQGIALKCVLVGGVDPYNPSAYTEDTLLRWVNEGIVECWGHREDMASVYAAAHLVVLPSYHEGLPKVLLEGAASGRPLIATRVRGCQEVVRDEDNGLLVPARNALALAEALRRLAADRALRLRMGARARDIAVQEFSHERIGTETLAIYRQALASFGAALRPSTLQQ